MRHALWNLVQNSDLSTVQFVAVWCEYAHAKQVDLNHHGEYYFGLDKNVFVTLSKKDLISVSLKALKNGLEQHLEFINLWKESCHQIHEQDGNEQETEKDTGDEPRESEDEVASVSTRASSRTIGRIRELPTLAPGQAVARRSLAPKKKHSSRKRPLPKSQDEDQSSPRKRGRSQKYPPSPESAAKMPKSLSPTKIARPRKNSMSKSSTTKPEDKDHDAVTAIAVTPSLKTHAPGTARLQVRSDDDPSSSRSSKRLIKPRNRFDPCNGNGRLWSEAGQPIRKIPEHALMKKSTGRKRSNRIFDIAERQIASLTLQSEQQKRECLLQKACGNIFVQMTTNHILSRLSMQRVSGVERLKLLIGGMVVSVAYLWKACKCQPTRTLTRLKQTFSMLVK